MLAREVSAHAAAKHLHAVAEAQNSADDANQAAGPAFSQLLSKNVKLHWKRAAALHDAADASGDDARAKIKTKASDGANSALNGAAAQTQQQNPQQPAAGTSDGTDSTAAQDATAAGGASGGDPTAQGADAAQADPLAADEVQARVALGAPTYLSQPNATLAGLWHRAAALGEGGASDGNAAPAPAAANAADQKAPETGAGIAKLAAAAAETRATHTSPALDATDPKAAQQDPTANVQTAAAPTASQDGVASASFAPSHLSAPPAGAAANPAPVPQLPMFAPAAEQVALSLKQAAQDGTDRIEIQLKPASLGAIEVKLNLAHDGHVTAVISADRSDTLNVLRQDSGALHQALRDAGLQTDSGSLSFNLRGDAQSFAQNSSGSTGGGSSDSDAAPIVPAAAAPRARYHRGTIDIEV